MTLPSRMADFVPGDRKLQNAYCRDHVAVTDFFYFACEQLMHSIKSVRDNIRVSNSFKVSVSFEAILEVFGFDKSPSHQFGGWK